MEAAAVTSMSSRIIVLLSLGAADKMDSESFGIASRVIEPLLNLALDGVVVSEVVVEAEAEAEEMEEVVEIFLSPPPLPPLPPPPLPPPPPPLVPAAVPDATPSSSLSANFLASHSSTCDGCTTKGST